MAESFCATVSPPRTVIWLERSFSPDAEPGLFFPFRMTRLKTTRGGHRTGASHQPRLAKRAR
jgi:hypothetical protein